jgi:hypothetical protein
MSRGMKAMEENESEIGCRVTGSGVSVSTLESDNCRVAGRCGGARIEQTGQAEFTGTVCRQSAAAVRAIAELCIIGPLGASGRRTMAV